MKNKYPNFFIIGAAKSGTTSLYNYLVQHPQIFMSPIKEPHYFSYQEKLLYSNGPGDRKRMKFATADQQSYFRLFENVKNEKRIGEASTTYLDSAEAPHRIKKFYPNAKIIAILRNPVDRAYASFMHLKRDGEEIFSNFEKALQEEKKRIENKWSVLWHYKTRQFTYEKLYRYYDIFHGDQIKVYEYENWKNNNFNILKDIYSFLEIDENFEADLSKKFNVGSTPKYEFLHNFIRRENILKKIVKILIPDHYRSFLTKNIINFNLERVPLSSKTRNDLLNFYKEDIKKLEALTKLDLSHWLNNEKENNSALK